MLANLGGRVLFAILSASCFRSGMQRGGKVPVDSTEPIEEGDARDRAAKAVGVGGKLSDQAQNVMRKQCPRWPALFFSVHASSPPQRRAAASWTALPAAQVAIHGGAADAIVPRQLVNRGRSQESRSRLVLLHPIKPLQSINGRPRDICPASAQSRCQGRPDVGHQQLGKLGPDFIGLQRLAYHLGHGGRVAVSVQALSLA
mgnify:CR=1 FL=1